MDSITPLGQADLIETYAFPLPIIVIAHLLGVPAEDRHKFRIWSDAVVTPDFSPGSIDRFVKLMEEFTDYLGKLFDDRRQHPQDDLLSALVKAEEEGDRLSEDELFSTVIILIIAGHETTAGLIGNAALALLQNPKQLTMLKENPSKTAAAVEELLRFDGPVERALTRWAAEDLQIGGHLIKRGEFIIPILAAADRDPEHFLQPDVLELDRNSQGHLAFGRGIHYCLGAPLARLEAEIAINTMLRRLPNIRLDIAPSDLEWRLVPLFHALTALPVTWDI
jgi:cytochrome P450